MPYATTVSSSPWNHELYYDSKHSPPGNRGNPIPGWDGPYISKPLSVDDSPYNGELVLMSTIHPVTFVGSVYLTFLTIPGGDALLINEALDTNESGPSDHSGSVIYSP